MYTSRKSGQTQAHAPELKVRGVIQLLAVIVHVPQLQVLELKKKPEAHTEDVFAGHDNAVDESPVLSYNAYESPSIFANPKTTHAVYII